MLTGIALRCATCGATPSRDYVQPGAVAACVCGARLALAAPTVFACVGCGVRSKPALIDLHEARPCPTCSLPLAAGVLPAGEQPTVLVEPAAPVESPFISWTPGDPDVHDSRATAHGRTAAGTALAPGSRFGRYEIVRELARGGMGIVCVARDPALKREVALKVLIAGELATPEAIARFAREARAAGQLRHPNIVAVHDAGDIDGRHYFTMDLVRGQELAKLLDNGGVARPHALAWLRDIARAVHHAHEHGIIHRDLKPQNIIIDEQGRPLVMDFGLAKDVSSQTFQSLSGAIFGTPAYMSPEQARGDIRRIDRRSDVYSLGVILYEAATGRRPFGGDTLFDTMRAVVNDEPAAPHLLRPDIDADLDTVILRCLEKDPAHRYPTAKALADDLDALLSGRPVSARPLPAPLRLWRRLRRHPVALAGGIGGAVALVLIVLLLSGESLVGRLERELASSDETVVAAATTLLAGEIRAGRLQGSDHEQALKLLRARIGHAPEAAERTALAALVAAQDAASGPLALTRASDATAPVAVRSAAAEAAVALVTTDTPPAAGTLLAAAVACGDADLAAILSGAAMRLDHDGTTSALTPVLTDPSRAPRWRAQLVAAVGAHRPPLHAASMRLLLRLAGDSEPRVGDAAARALELVRTREQVLAFYGLEGNTAALAAGMGRMAQAIAERERLMYQLGDDAPTADNAVAVIARRLSSGTVDERLAAAWDLGRFADGAVIPPLVAAIDDPISAVRRTALRSLADRQAGDAVDAALTRAFAHAETQRHADAAYGAGLLRRTPFIPTLTTVTTTTDSVAWPAAVQALGRLGAIDAVATAWEHAGSDDAQMLVIAALAERQAHAGAAVDALIACLDQARGDVRTAVVEALHAATGETFGADAARWRTWALNRRSP